MGQQASFPEATGTVQEPTYNFVGRLAPRGLLDIQTEWLNRMVTTTTPLVERMTLFLHDHFATAYRPGDIIDTQELTAQNHLFRRTRSATGRRCATRCSRTWRCRRWLDNNVNVKEHPNENLARELMELFTLGVGNYTETDVREAARALTGYQIGYNLEPRGPRNIMVFNAELHDDEHQDDPRHRPGKFMPHDVIDIILRTPGRLAFLAASSSKRS